MRTQSLLLRIAEEISMYRKMVVLMGIMIILGAPDLSYSKTEEMSTLTASDAERMIKEYLREHTPWREDQIKVKNISIAGNIILPSTWDYEITPAPKATMIGRTAFSVNINANGKPMQTSWINADIEVWVDVVLAVHTMKERQVIGDDDIYVGKKDLAELPPGYADDIGSVAGKRVKRFVGTNRPITQDMLEEPPLFKRGEKVFIVAESETLKIIATGTAESDGYKGRPVKVMNMQSRKEVSGEVIDNTTVRVKW